MSREAIKAIETAISKYVAAVRGNDQHDQVVVNWFVAYETMQSHPESDAGVSHSLGYVTSESSPAGVVGCADLGLGHLKNDLSLGNWGAPE